jgi:hypothetical protein
LHKNTLTPHKISTASDTATLKKNKEANLIEAIWAGSSHLSVLHQFFIQTSKKLK